jgi:quinol monooxygenase YgiN
MIVEYIRYQLKTHTAAELTEAYERAAEHLRRSPDCLSYELSHCSEDPSNMTLRIVWTSAEGHTARFRKSAEFPPFLRLIRPFFAEIVEMRHYAPTSVSWACPAKPPG